MSSLKTTENICRTCLSTHGELISLFSGISDTARLTNKIENISDVKINDRDGLPYMICRKCIFLIESFDCFKKQIESANEQIKNVWPSFKDESAQAREIRSQEKIQNFKEEEEKYDDSDWEIQYISDEVKSEVENAFRRKQESIRKKELADFCTNLENFHDIALVPIEDIINKKKETRDWKRKEVNTETNESHSGEKKNVETSVMSYSLFQFTGAIDQKEFEDVEQNLSQPDESYLLNENMTNENLDDAESETLQSANSDCNERLIIEIEESDDIDEKTLELEYVDVKRKKIPAEYHDQKENFEPVKMESIKQIFLDPLDLDRDNEKKIFNADETEEKTPEPRYDNWKDSSKPEEIKNIEKNILEPGETDSEDKRESFGSEKLDIIEKNTPKLHELDFGNVKNFDAQKSNNIQKERFQTEQFRYGNEEEAMVTEKLASNEEEAMETNNLVSNEKEPTYTQIHDTRNENNKNKQIRDIENFEIDEKSLQPEKIFVNGKKCCKKKLDYPANDYENSKTMLTDEKISIPMKNCIFHKATTCDDVIVISSDSSDEERRKIYMEMTSKRDSSWLSRREKKKLFQSRVTTRNNHVLQFKNKKMPKEGNSKINVEPGPMKSQARKYFQCTTCNISLYSVSAVLYHHNRTHTPPQELLSCQMCDVKFPTRVILLAHFNKHVESHLFRCNYCTCEFVLKRNLRAHMNAHMRPKTIEPENKRLKIGESSSKVEIPTKENFAGMRDGVALGEREKDRETK